MKKNLLALALIGSISGLACAQSNVTIYGIVDTGFIKETGSDVKMGENINNRIGFRGPEDLGSGYKATFQLEKRFNLNDGTINGVDWEGASNLGISSPFGAVRFGRLNELPTETFRTLDPFNQFGVGSMLLSSQRSTRLSNTVRYDSPILSGFKLGATYTLGKNTNSDTIALGDIPMKNQGADNDGYAVSVKYDNGPVSALANWSRLSDSNDSSVWNLGGAYSFGPAKVSLGYEKTHDKGWKQGSIKSGKRSSQDNWILGLVYQLGAGRVNASFSYMDIDHSSKWNGSKDIKKYSLGYEHKLSKRTTLYGMVSWSDFENEQVADFYRGSSVNDSVTGVQVGITHKF